MPTTWPLTGRSEELDFVVQAMRDEAGNGVAIAGPAGVGKTRLAREIGAVLGSDFAVEWAAATPSAASIPFGALAHLVPDVDPATSPDDRLWLFRKIAAALLARADGRPVLLVVDDAQWLDPSAATLVHHLVTTRTARVLLTIRIGEPAPDAISALWKDAFVARLELQPLTRLDVDALLEAVLEGPVDRPTLERFCDLSGGNALYLRELVLGVLETRAFASVDGVWRWTGNFEASIRLSTILDDRLARVTTAGRLVLDCLAVGEPLPLNTLVALSEAEGVAEVERCGLAVVDEVDELAVRLSHPLYAEQLRAEMSVVDRLGITARLADAFAHSAPRSRRDLMRLACWQLEGGGRADAALLTEAAEVARTSFDLPLAERLARRAVDAGGGLRASLALTWALRVQGRCREALAVIEPIPTDALSGNEYADVAGARYAALAGAYGFRAEFDDVLRAAEERVDDPTTRSYLQAQRTSLLALAGQLDQAIALGTPLIEGTDEATALRAVPGLGAALGLEGKWDAALAVSERMLEPALRHRDDIPQAPFWVVGMQLQALWGSGRLDDADALIERIEATVGSDAARGDVAGFLAFGRGMIALRRGQVRTSARWLREAAGGMRDVADFRLPLVLTLLVEACALAGDADGAGAASEEADELISQRAAVTMEGGVRGARGWAAFARGEPAAAVKLVLDAADWCGSNRLYGIEVACLYDALRLGADRRAAPRHVALGAEHEGAWARGVAAHAAGVLADDGAALDAAATQFEEIGACLLAAEAAAGAAAAFRRAGLLARSERSTARAQVLLAACEGARSPGLDELAGPLPLTAREREVALLATEGLSAKAISERLSVSTRTVEGHLYRAYTKLGVTDRSGLARILTSER